MIGEDVAPLRAEVEDSADRITRVIRGRGTDHSNLSKEKRSWKKWRNINHLKC